MVEVYKSYKGRKLKVKDAVGTVGILIRTLDLRYALRVYRDSDNKDEPEFVDYALRHSDLEVKILDELSSFYEDEEGNTWLDHDPKTLGYTKIE